MEQAEEKYGLTVLSFVGRVRDYDPTAKAKYQNADHVAVTTYSSLFNTNPYFATEDVLILDDAHAAENYVASAWTLIIDREETQRSIPPSELRSDHTSTPPPFRGFRASRRALVPALGSTNYRRRSSERLAIRSRRCSMHIRRHRINSKQNGNTSGPCCMIT